MVEEVVGLLGVEAELIHREEVVEPRDLEEEVVEAVLLRLHRSLYGRLCWLKLGELRVDRSQDQQDISRYSLDGVESQDLGALPYQGNHPRTRLHRIRFPRLM